MEIIALLRQLADELEKGQKPVFNIDDAATREALESLFNVWYGKEYEKLEEKLDEISVSVDSHESKFDDLPDGISDWDLGELEDRIDSLETKLRSYDEDDIETVSDLAQAMGDVDVKALASLDLGEVAEMVSWFRTMKAHFAPRREREAA